MLGWTCNKGNVVVELFLRFWLEGAGFLRFGVSGLGDVKDAEFSARVFRAWCF